MPILPKQPDFSPALLLDQVAATTVGPGRWIPAPDERMLVDDLRAIDRLVHTEQLLAPEARLEPGQAFRLRSGPPTGIEGAVVTRRGTERLIMAVRIRDHDALIELEDSDLESL